MLKKIGSSIGLMLLFFSSIGFGSKSLIYGEVGTHYSSILQKLRAEEVKIFQATTKESITLKKYPSHIALVQSLEKNPNYLSFIYVKSVLNPSMTKLQNWKKIAQVVEIDPENSKANFSYNAYIIVEKNSNISGIKDLANKTMVYYDDQSVSNYINFKHMLADKHISGIRWVKAKNVASALQLIRSGKADAMCIWHNLFSSQSNTKSFKIIDKIYNLPTPNLYVNTNSVNPQQIANIKQMLKTIKPQAGSPFYYKIY